MNAAAFFLSALLPLETPELSPGDVERTAQHFDLPSPICIIGDDRRSRHWIAQRIDTLRSLNAACFAVDVRDQHSWSALRSAAGSIALSPVHGKVFADRFGIAHYPIVITREGYGQ